MTEKEIQGGGGPHTGGDPLDSLRHTAQPAYSGSCSSSSERLHCCSNLLQDGHHLIIASSIVQLLLTSIIVIIVGIYGFVWKECIELTTVFLWEMEENIKQNIRMNGPNSSGICVVSLEYWGAGVCRGGQRARGGI